MFQLTATVGIVWLLIKLPLIVLGFFFAALVVDTVKNLRTKNWVDLVFDGIWLIVLVAIISFLIT